MYRRPKTQHTLAAIQNFLTVTFGIRTRQLPWYVYLGQILETVSVTVVTTTLEDVRLVATRLSGQSRPLWRMVVDSLWIGVLHFPLKPALSPCR